MMPKRKSVIQQVIVLLTVLAMLCSCQAVSGSLTGSAEKLIDERLQMESLFKTAESTPPALTTSKPGSFNADIFSSASVWTPKETWPPRGFAWQGCRDVNCILEYMKKSGANDEALYFTRKIAPEALGSDGYLETFEEKGRVDLGFVFLPFRANTNGAFVFLNGSPSVVSSEQRGVEQLDISGDSNYPMLKKQYPQLQIWGNGAGFVSEHANTKGGQRFILGYDLVNYCHACSVGWKAQVAYDFSKDGTFEGKKFLKLVQDTNFAGSGNQGMSADADLFGNWDGSVYQPGSGTYMALMSFHNTNGTVEYPSLGCGGTVTLLGNSGNEYRYAENITYGNVASGGRCIDGGLITAKIQGDSMDWDWSGQWQGRGYTAKGVLARENFAGSGNQGLNENLVPQSALPPIPYEDYGACPFECCTYRRWIAAKDTAIQQDRYGNSATLFNVNKGEWVTALTGVVKTTVPGKAKVLRPTMINGITAKSGEIAYLMTYQGEGVYETWYKGRKWEPYPDMSALEIIENPESTWWVQIKNNIGQVGWSKEPDNFDNRDACGGNVEEPSVPACNAPIANSSSHLYNPDFDCRQHWEYYLFLQLSGSTFRAAMDIISRTQEKALYWYNVLEIANILAQPYKAIKDSPAKMIVFNTMWESTGLAVNLVPEAADLGVAGEVAIDLISLTRELLSVTANHLATGAVTVSGSYTPHALLFTLANRLGALWNIQVKVLREINAIRLAQEYLNVYYRYGGDSAKVAASYGLPNSTTTEDVIKSLAKKMGIARLDYSLTKTTQWISSFKEGISNAATVCLQGNDCTATK